MSIHILAIETSCDETSAAVVADGKTICSNVIYTQIATHKAYGGVVPEIASREHLRKISAVVKTAIAESGVSLHDLDAVAVTKGPGLIGSLLVGLSYGKAVAETLDVPLIGVHHLAGHLYGGIMSADGMEPPLVALIASGGHSSVVYLREHLRFEVMGETRDDAAGEVLDKVARSLGLPYPGGAALEELAAKGNPDALDFPRAWLEQNSFDFSFSGLKSHVLNYLNRAAMKGETVNMADVAASFQKSLFEVLAQKAVNACKTKGVDRLILSGGVAANNTLRQTVAALAATEKIRFHYPPKTLCTDNAAMIGAVAYYKYLHEEFNSISLNATANIPLENE
ncbi:MAG TPA: tRNA (adenosine(37)-N6)-threonylcarbamoyltransferase complex transferase subunit TsaD [Clostridiales bacterium]|nr:tRNA (adenosine(37)-N6)-threonylcarbamoyltransferase complex transferase subunit TsaD [Clostridiales bacterium]